MDNKENAKKAMAMYRSGSSKTLKEAWIDIKKNNKKDDKDVKKTKGTKETEDL